jgi:hypothetical protein
VRRSARPAVGRAAVSQYRSSRSSGVRAERATAARLGRHRAVRPWRIPAPFGRCRRATSRRVPLVAGGSNDPRALHCREALVRTSHTSSRPTLRAAASGAVLGRQAEPRARCADHVHGSLVEAANSLGQSLPATATARSGRRPADGKQQRAQARRIGLLLLPPADGIYARRFK